MDHILWLARIFGPFLFIMGLWVVLRNDEAQKLVQTVKSTPGLISFGAVCNLLFGLGILSTYSSWSFSLPVLITILGWIMILRGILVFFAPDKAMDLTNKVSANLKTWGIVTLVYGFLLCLVAFT